jgi:hypothetical protein
MTRPVDARYVDPLDHIWLTAAAELGLTVRRSPLGYATTDGKGCLMIAPAEDFDADDCLAQIILHELCHALVQGEGSFRQPDWGLSNDSDSAAYTGDTVREEACLRVQAALLRRYGLRRLLAPTTDFRTFYDALPRDPLAAGAGAAADPALALAAEGLARAARPPFRKPLHQALKATAELHRLLPKATTPAPAYDAARALATTPTPMRMPKDEPTTPLWQRAPAPARHKSGLPMSDGLFTAPAGATCATCAYVRPPPDGRRPGSWRCQRTAAPDGAGLVVDPAAAGCALHQAHLDCQTCGACCRHAYDLVPVGKSEPTVTLHPSLIVRRGKQCSILRDDARRRCAALAGPDLGPYSCQIYDDRPSTCREFAAGTSSCLDARRRVGWEA